MNITCREYQTIFIADIKKSIVAGNKRIIACASTGSGKSVVLASIAKSALEKNKKIIIVLPRRSLVLQLSETFTYYKINHGVVMAGEPQYLGSRCQIVSIDTYLARYVSGRMLFIDADILCLDEMHTQFTEKKLDVFGKYPLVIGFSATPIAPKNKPLNVFYDSIVESIPMKELISQGYLSPLKYFAPTDFHPENIKLNTDGEYNESALIEYVDSKLKDEDGKRVLVGDILKSWNKLARDRKTVVFCATQSHARYVCNEFIDNGIKALYVDCNTPDDERKIIFDSTEKGKNQIIVNVGIISMGTDIPILSCVVLARPTNSVAGYLQCVGRVTRPCEGKQNGLVIDHCGIVAKLGFAEEEQYWSLDGKETPEERKKKANEEAKEPKILTCKDCGTSFSGSRKCPACGYEMVPQGEAIPIHEAEMVEIKESKPKPADKKRFYSELLGYAKKNNKTSSFALAIFRKKYNEWPHSKNSAKPLEPSAETLGYIKYSNIAWAKANRKYS